MKKSVLTQEDLKRNFKVNRKIGLKKEYVKVCRKKGEEVTFGGDQNLFAFSGASKEDERKVKCGCGIIAFADLLLYLGGAESAFRVKESLSYVNRKLSEDDYRNYYNTIYTYMGGISGKVGISGLKIWRCFNRMARREGWRLRAKWAFSGKKLNGRIEEMLQNDIPVICCIPMMLLKKDKKDRLPLYLQVTADEQETAERSLWRVGASTCAHYVMITGIIQEQEEEFYEISTWGKKMYMSRNEYDAFIHNHFMGTILGNILYVYAR